MEATEITPEQEAMYRFNEAFERYKPFINKLGEYDSKRDEMKLPDLYPGYIASCELYEDIKPHAKRKYFPERFFRERAPNEKEDEFRYRKGLYKALGSPTRRAWVKAMAQLNRIWNAKNYTLTLPTIEDAKYKSAPPQDYFFNNYPNYQSIEAYFRSVVTTEKINDPNALLCIKPKEVPDETEMLEPVAYITHCNDVFLYDENEYALVKSKEKSEIKVGAKTKKEGLVFFYYDRMAIYKISQTGKKEEYKFALELYYQHNLDRLPCYKLKGIPNQEEQYLFYESYFGPALPSLNDALSDSSTLRMSKVSHAYLQRWEYAPDCDGPACENGYVWEGEQRRRCDVCHGTGKRTYLSPLSVMQVNPPSGNIAGENTKDMTIPPAGYIPLDHAILDFLSGEVDKNIEAALSILNINTSNSQPKGSETALGKMIDREGLFSFLLNISTELFELYENTLNIIGEMRYPGAWEPVAITYPQNFTIRTEAELTDEIAKARENDLPQSVQKKLMLNYINTRFNSDEKQERFFNLMVNADPLFNYNVDELVAVKSVGMFKDWIFYLHNNVSSLVEELLNNNPDFFSKAYLEQQSELYKLAQERYTSENPGTTAANLLTRTNIDV